MTRRAWLCGRWLRAITAAAWLPLLFAGCGEAPPGVDQVKLADIKTPPSAPEADPEVSIYSVPGMSGFAETNTAHGRFLKFSLREQNRTLNVLLPAYFKGQRLCKHDWEQLCAVYANRETALERTALLIGQLEQITQRIQAKMLARMRQARTSEAQQAALLTAIKEVRAALPPFIQKVRASKDPQSLYIAGAASAILAQLKRPEVIQMVLGQIDTLRSLAEQQQGTLPAGGGSYGGSEGGYPSVSPSLPAVESAPMAPPPGAAGGPGAAPPPVPGGMEMPRG